MYYKSRSNQEDVVQSSLSELILFLLFFFLILLASYVSSNSAGGNTPDKDQTEYLQQLGQLENENRNLLKEGDGLRNELDEQKKRTVNAEENAEGVKIRLRQSNELVGTFRRKLANLSGKLQENIGKLAEALNSNEELLAENERFRKTIKASEEQAEALGTTVASLGEMNSTLHAELDAIKASNKELDRHLEGQNNDITDANLQVQRLLLQIQIQKQEAKQSKLNSQIEDLSGKVLSYDTDVESLRLQKNALQKVVNSLNAELKTTQAALKATDWPASLNLPDNAGYRFESGSYVPSRQFLNLFYGHGLREILSRLRELDGEIKYIEVIGHTDEQFHSRGQTSNLDRQLLSFVSYGRSERISGWVNLDTADNAGLGLARASAISILIRDAIQKRYPNIEILPYSAGQMVENVSRKSKLAAAPPSNVSQRQRRRIEIRFKGEQ
jgi:hypothetical protein